MSRPISAKRPWLAALLSALVTGLGHLYLRRWRRALGWLVVLFAVTALLVDPMAVEAFASGGAVDPVAMAPTLFVAALSVLDAYVLARAHNEVARLAADRDGGLVHCPNCGGELDPDLDFCHWCTAAVADLEDAPPEGGEKREG